jgi:hypothetical protein
MTAFAVEPSVERTSCTLASWRISSSSELPELPELPGFHLFTVSPPQKKCKNCVPTHPSQAEVNECSQLCPPLHAVQGLGPTFRCYCRHFSGRYHKLTG